MLKNMPTAASGRLVRRTKLEPHQKTYRINQHRDAFPLLKEEFDGRCVYSGQHVSLAGGDSQMEVDHFDPRTKTKTRQSYFDYVLATAHCNGKKWDYPLTGKPRRKIRGAVPLINPCEERDYGLHIFEDPRSCRLWGATERGRTQIRQLDLNAPHFVEERRMRAYDWSLIENPGPIRANPKEPLDKIADVINQLRRHAEQSIPRWEVKEAPPDHDWVD